MKRKLFTVLLLVLILTAGIFLHLFRNDTSYEGLIEGISLKEAKQIVQNTTDCYIVEFSHAATGPQYRIADGPYAGSDIELTGDYTPTLNLSGVFFYADNRFLVYADAVFHEENLGKENIASDQDCFTVHITDWIPILPIKRQYQFRDYQQNSGQAYQSRLFYPKDKIDAFDEQNNDYILK